MKRAIIAAIAVLVLATSSFAESTVECNVSSLKIRRSPEVGASMVGGLMKGEKATVIEKGKTWTKVRFKNDREGYAYTAYLKFLDETKPAKAEEGQKKEAPADVKEVKVEAKAAAAEEKSLLDPETAPVKQTQKDATLSAKPAKVENQTPVQQEKPLRTVMLASDKNNEEIIETLRATNEALVKEIAAMRKERAEIQAMKQEITENIRCVVKEREENERRAQHAEQMQKKAEAEVAEIKNSLQFGGNSRLITLADNGDKAYFKGVGEVNLAFEGGRTVLRVKESAADQAQKALASASPEKYLKNGYAYFIVESKSLAF